MIPLGTKADDPSLSLETTGKKGEEQTSLDYTKTGEKNGKNDEQKGRGVIRQ